MAESDLTGSSLQSEPAAQGADKFDKTALNRYLGTMDAAAWSEIKAAAEGASAAGAESAVATALPKVELTNLAQVDDSDDDATIRTTGKRVRDELRKLAEGMGPRRSAAETVAAALTALEQTNPEWTLDNPDFIRFAKNAWFDSVSEAATEEADYWAERLDGFPVLDEFSLNNSMKYRGLPDFAAQLVTQLLGSRGIRVVADVPEKTFNEIEKLFPKGIAQALYPEVFRDNPEATISIVDATVEGAEGEPGAQVRDAAVNYFTTSPQFSKEKDFVSRLGTEELRDWFSSFYLQAFRKARDVRNSIDEGAQRLASMGVDEDEVRQLVASQGGSSRLAAEHVDPEISAERAQQIDRQTFGSLERAAGEGRLAQAKYELDQLLESGERARSSVGADIIESIQSQARKLERDTASLDQAIRARNPIAARQELDSIAEYCVDSRTVGDLAVYVNEMEHDPAFIDQVVDTHFQPIQDEGKHKALGFLPPKFSNAWLTPLALGIPAALLDTAFSSSTFLSCLATIFVLSVIGVFIEEYIDADGCVGWLATLGPAVIALFGSGFFGAVAVGASQFASKTIFKNRELQKHADAFNKLVERTRTELKAAGAGSQVAGYYVGQQRIVPATPAPRRQSATGAYVVDGNGNVVEAMNQVQIARMHANNQFVGKNAWMNQKVGQ
ncbi:hypothetical protein V6D40_05275 [Corynebacterium sp. Q4381]|uniref:hypothetical protein n=1 Tax=Corynebacterium sp. Marseille-Q4381 TaxID=3121597 RepID=UPI002FE5AF1A